MLLCKLIRNLDVLILDEPFTGIDHENIMKLLDLLFRHVNTYKNICILTLHQPTLDMQQYITILVLKNHVLELYDGNMDDDPLVDCHDSASVLSNPKRYPNYWKILLSRELLLIRHKPLDLLYRFMSVICIAVFKITMIGFYGKSLLHVSQSSNVLDQIAYFMHLFISFVTVSLLPITSLHEFQYKNDIFANEIDQGWYPYFFIHDIYLFKECLIFFLMGVFVLYNPITYYHPFFWVYYVNIVLQIQFSTILLHCIYIVFHSQSIQTITGFHVLYNIISLLSNIVYINNTKNLFLTVVQYMSFIHLQNLKSLIHYNNHVSQLLQMIDLSSIRFPLTLSFFYLTAVFMVHHVIISFRSLRQK